MFLRCETFDNLSFYFQNIPVVLRGLNKLTITTQLNNKATYVAHVWHPAPKASPGLVIFHEASYFGKNTLLSGVTAKRSGAPFVYKICIILNNIVR